MPFPVTQQNEPHSQDVTIAASGNLSPVFHIPTGHEIATILMPAVWTAAVLTFQAGVTSAAIKDVFDTAGNEVSITVDIVHCIPIAPHLIHGSIWLKIRSGTSGTPVAQGDERIITLITRPTA